jgi:two-component system sensor histidine kinase KdpD
MLSGMSDTPAVLRLLALAGHELRTPATVIGGCLRLIRMSADRSPERREQILAQAERNYERLVEVLGELSDLWRLETGEAVFNRQPVDLARVIAGAVSQAAPRLPGGVTARVEDPSPAACVVGDPTRLERAFAALILAVGRHAADGASIAIRTEIRTSVPGRVSVAVADDDRADAGSGVEPSAGPVAALDEFESGLGLALPIARRVLEAEGGSIGVQTGSAGRTIVAELPLHQPPGERCP